MPITSASSKFPHRTNEDGMIDSICPHCFVTIGSSNREDDLEKMELAHVCDASLVSYYEESKPLRKQPFRGSRPPNSRRKSA
jgi:hypothetical protein